MVVVRNLTNCVAWNNTELAVQHIMWFLGCYSSCLHCRVKIKRVLKVNTAVQHATFLAHSTGTSTGRDIIDQHTLVYIAAKTLIYHDKILISIFYFSMFYNFYTQLYPVRYFILSVTIWGIAHCTWLDMSKVFRSEAMLWLGVTKLVTLDNPWRW
jgi:hypothetical protein